MVIRQTDRVREVIGRDAGLIEVLAGLSPALEGLRHPKLRQVMSGLLTMEQVAQMAGLDPDALLTRLNDGQGGGSEAAGAGNPGRQVPSGEVTWPPALSAIPEHKMVRVDVREDLKAGREPFGRIMAARREVPEGGALCVRATFEPVPLYSVIGRQGFSHHAERLADDDWQVWFYPEVSASGEESPASAATSGNTRPDENAAAPAEDDVIVLDVRGLEPPEPMLRTLEALESLPEGHTLAQLNVRVPQFLLPQLEERGFTYEIREQSRDLVRVFIRRAGLGGSR